MKAPAICSDSDAAPRGLAEMCSKVVITSSLEPTGLRSGSLWGKLAGLRSGCKGCVMAVTRDRAAVGLPVLPGPPPALRADAARNRAKLLLAAADLFSARGVEAVSLDDVVSAAGVGKGTLYRIFGDKSGLAAALLDEQERDLQERVLSGPPPLGPGAGGRARLSAFIDGYVAYVAGNVDLVRMSQTARPGARFDIGSHQFWRTHLRYLLTEAGAPSPGTAADVLLAAMTAEQIDHWIRRENRDRRRVASDLTQLAESWCSPNSPRGR